MLNRCVTIKKFMIERLGFVGIKILLALHGKRNALYIREILREAKISSSTINRALSVLTDFGLITCEYKYNRRFVKLTRYGIEVAEHIYQADEKIKEAMKKKKEILNKP